MDASLKKTQGDGLRLLRESIYGNLFYLGSGWILAGDSTGKNKMKENTEHAH